MHRATSKSLKICVSSNHASIQRWGLRGPKSIASHCLPFRPVRGLLDPKLFPFVSGGAARIAHRMARGPCVGLCAAGRRVIGSVLRFEGTDVELYIDCWITGILGAVTVRMSCMAQYTTSHRKNIPKSRITHSFQHLHPPIM